MNYVATDDKSCTDLNELACRYRNKQVPWPESASELYRPSDRRLLVKLASTFADRGVSRGQRGESLRP
jgi:hypothetical protein